MIIKNMPGPTAEAGRKTSQAGTAQKSDHFASELKKQMSSGHKPQSHKADESSKASQPIKKPSTDEKAQHQEADVLATLPPGPADPLALLVDGNPLAGQTTTGDVMSPADDPLQQPATQEAPLAGLETLMPAVTLAASPPQTPVGQGEISQALAMTDNDPLALPSQAAAVLPGSAETSPPQTAANGAPDSLTAKSETRPVQADARLPTGSEAPKEGMTRPAAFAENMASAMQNTNTPDALPVQHLNQTHSAPVVASAPIIPASIATPTPVTPAIPTMATGTLQADVGTHAWQQSLGQQIAVFSRNGIHHAELRLHPEDLGALQISLKMNNDQAQVHFVAESHQVRAALESAMPHLRTMLAESGIQLGQSSVGADTASSSGAAFSGDSSGQRNGGQEGAEPGVLVEDERIIQPAIIKYSSGINTFV